MTVSAQVLLRPITSNDVPAVSRFLHDHLNARLSAADWADAMTPSWSRGHAPNHGFMLESGERIVGANLAFYSERTQGDRTERFCNLAALCVTDDARPHTLRLVRALLKQPGYTFTDFSPSGNVVAINERLGFQHLDVATVLSVNRPGRRRRGTQILADLAHIERRLVGDELTLFRDHRASRAVRHLLLERAGRQCYVMFRLDRRKRLRTFASLLHVGDPELYRAEGGQLGGHLLGRHRALVTLAELRVIGGRPQGWHTVVPGRPKMFKSAALDGTQVDYLYSELTCVRW